MAVEILNSNKNTNLDVFYDFGKKEDLKITSPTHYQFNEKTLSKFRLLDKTFVPKNIFITEKIHKANRLNQECELILETLHGESFKMFICIGLRFQTTIENDEWIFPLRSANLEQVVSQCKTNYMYQTKSGNLVCVCKKSLYVNGVKPSFSVTPKDAYKDIIDNDSYDVLSLITTAGDSHTKKVQSKASNVVFKKMLYDTFENEDETKAEGFIGGNYMECELLHEDATDISQVYKDVAVVPLQTNAYERGIASFSHFLHFFLVTVGAGFGYPVLVNALLPDNPNPNIRSILGYITFFLFFIFGFLLIVIGLSMPDYRKPTDNDRKIVSSSTKVDGMVMAVVGFYFMLIHCSSALGMFGFKKFALLDFVKHFGDPKIDNALNLSYMSFFDVMESYKIS
jgi:hypothetical protein